jgi:hypothetical protein
MYRVWWKVGSFPKSYVEFPDCQRGSFDPKKAYLFPLYQDALDALTLLEEILSRYDDPLDPVPTGVEEVPMFIGQTIGVKLKFSINLKLGRMAER